MSHPDILLNEDIYPEANEFLPERWFHASDLQNRMFVPFGKGTRMCIGME
jgi:cytochrome P450